VTSYRSIIMDTPSHFSTAPCALYIRLPGSCEQNWNETLDKPRPGCLDLMIYLNLMIYRETLKITYPESGKCLYLILGVFFPLIGLCIFPLSDFINYAKINQCNCVSFKFDLYIAVLLKSFYFWHTLCKEMKICLEFMLRRRELRDL